MDGRKLITAVVEKSYDAFLEVGKTKMLNGEKMGAEDIKILERVCVQFGFVAVYLESRFDGDSHSVSLRRANSARKKIWAALGYTMNRSPLEF